MVLFWLIFAGGFLAWGYNGLSTRQNARLLLRTALTPIVVPLLFLALIYAVGLPIIGFYALWVHVSPLAALGALGGGLLVLAVLGRAVWLRRHP